MLCVCVCVKYIDNLAGYEDDLYSTIEFVYIDPLYPVGNNTMGAYNSLLITYNVIGLHYNL